MTARFTLTLQEELEALKAQIARDYAVRGAQYDQYVASGYIDERDISRTDFIERDYVIASCKLVAAGSAEEHHGHE